MLSVVELKHLGHILVEELKQVDDSFVLELILLFNFYVSFQKLVPYKVLKDFYTSIGQALKLVHYHFLIGTQLIVLTALLLV